MSSSGRTTALKEKIKGETVDGPGEMACAPCAKTRATCRNSRLKNDGGPQILECHTPLLNLLERYPIMARLEQDMFEAVLGTNVRREESRDLRPLRVRVLFLGLKRSPCSHSSVAASLCEAPGVGVSYLAPRTARRTVAATVDFYFRAR